MSGRPSENMRRCAAEPVTSERANRHRHQGTRRRHVVRNLIAFSFSVALAAFLAGAACADQDAPPSPPAVAVGEPYLGVFTAPVSEALRSQLSGLLAADEGLVVVQVLADSPAARSGIERHDVLARFAGAPISEAEQLNERIAAVRPGEQVVIDLVRRAERKSIAVTLAPRPAVSAAVGERIDSRQLARIAAGARISPASRAREGAAAVTPLSRDRSLRIATADGRRFDVELEYMDRGATVSFRRSGLADEIIAESRALPAELRDELKRGIAEAAGKVEAKPGVRVRLHPGLQGARRSVRIRLDQTGAAGDRRLVEIERELEPGETIEAGRLLEHPRLIEELGRLSPEVRQQVEATLRRVPLPEVRVQVRNAQ